MAKITRALSNSVNEQARSLKQWDQRYNQISSGEFSGSTTFLEFEGLTLARETMTLQVEQRASPPEGFVAFSVPSVANQIVHLDGESERDRVGLMWSGTRYHAMTERGSQIVVVTMKERMLLAALDELETKLSRTGTIAVNNVSILFRQLNDVLAAISTRPEVLFDEAFCRQTERYVVQQCAQAISYESESPFTRYSWQIDRKKIVRESCNAADEAGIERATLAIMQESCKVSPRILQYAFQEVLGISPSRWLKLAKLNKARRDIEDKRFSTVTEAALSCSFNHLGRFSTSYRFLFGESPTKTLQNLRDCLSKSPAM